MLEHAGGEPGVQEQLRERVGDRRRVLGRLPDHGVAAQQRRHEVPVGTATGKLPAVTIAAVPTGMRKVNSCLSGSSMGRSSRRGAVPRTGRTRTCRRLPGPRRATRAIGLPISRVISAARASRFASTRRPRAGSRGRAPARGSDAHAGCCGLGSAARVDDRAGIPERGLGDGRIEVGGIELGEEAARRLLRRAAVQE